MPLGEAIAITLQVTEVLESLGIEYLVGGSLASSLLGIPRATLDVDLVAVLAPEHVGPLVQALAPTFYIDEAAVADAIRRRASFNIIHLETVFKVDVFVQKDQPLARSEMSRKQTYELSDRPGVRLVVGSAEDIILQKLDWYRLGHEISERQWTDVLGVLKVQGDRLDLTYLRHWAAQVGLSTLVERALGTLGPRR